MVGIAGEVLITVGVLTLAFLGWQVWIGSAIAGASQQTQAVAQSRTWRERIPVAPTKPPAVRPDPGAPAIATAPGYAVSFANLIVPRFGADYARPVAEGTGTADVLRVGIGHYPGTQMPGDVGNAAFAAHRTGHGQPFFDIDKLEVGDSIYFEMEAGWYRYVVRSLEYVLPEGVGVLDAVPQFAGQTPTDRVVTLTSCNPIYGADERIVVYGVYDTWYPRAGGPPPEIASLVTTLAAG